MPVKASFFKPPRQQRMAQSNTKGIKYMNIEEVLKKLLDSIRIVL
jgi:hypothetical protein